MAILLITIVASSIGVLFFLKTKKFGKLPSGDRLAQIEKLDNYRNGAFQNQSPTPDLPEGVTYWDLVKKMLFQAKVDPKPNQRVPSVKTDLSTIAPDEDVLVWFGHSSYLLQVDGIKILVDPVLSGVASPISFFAKAFEGTDVYTTDDLPEVDYLFISHDHWDHLDYETVTAIESKVKKVVCGWGVGAHFEHWGYPPSKIIETNWYEQSDLADSLRVHTMPARHFSGRGFTRNKALWASYVIQTPNFQIYIGGDSGYDKHFAEIGNRFGEFDLVILENGQYDEHWPLIHIMPDEILTAAQELNAKQILPVHSGKFVLANHAWYEPLESIVQNNQAVDLNLLTPMIGEPVDLRDTTQTFLSWWRPLMHRKEQ